MRLPAAGRLRALSSAQMESAGSRATRAGVALCAAAGARPGRRTGRATPIYPAGGRAGRRREHGGPPGLRRRRPRPGAPRRGPAHGPAEPPAPARLFSASSRPRKGPRLHQGPPGDDLVTLHQHHHHHHPGPRPPSTIPGMPWPEPGGLLGSPLLPRPPGRMGSRGACVWCWVAYEAGRLRRQPGHRPTGGQGRQAGRPAGEPRERPKFRLPGWEEDGDVPVQNTWRSWPCLGLTSPSVLSAKSGGRQRGGGWPWEPGQRG